MSRKRRSDAAVRDKWRKKEWYDVIAPKIFRNTEIGSTPAGDPNTVTGRIVETTLYDITGDFSHSHINLHFRISEIKGSKAISSFKGHVLTRDYVRSLVRRGTSRIDAIFNVATKDEYNVRLQALIFTLSRAKTSQQKLIRQVTYNTITKNAKRLTFDKLAEEVVYGRLASKIANAVKVVLPIRKCEILSSKLLSTPEPSKKKPSKTVKATAS